MIQACGCVAHPLFFPSFEAYVHTWALTFELLINAIVLEKVSDQQISDRLQHRADVVGVGSAGVVDVKLLRSGTLFSELVGHKVDGRVVGVVAHEVVEGGVKRPGLQLGLEVYTQYRHAVLMVELIKENQTKSHKFYDDSTVCGFSFSTYSMYLLP